MRIKQIIYIAALGFLASCSEDITGIVSEESHDAIILRAGISDGSDGVMTRAAGGYDNIDASNHAKHLAFTEGTKAAIRIDGDWWKKDAASATLISQPTTATIGDETSTDSKHNDVSMSPQLFWDDYGTADPANAGSGKGREKGLTIFGAAVNGVTTAPTVDNWTAMTWNLGTPSGSPATLDLTGGWSTKDLLISNNVKVGGLDDTYKFDERSAGKLLEFTHAMSKITVRLIASDGFPTSGVGTTAKKFATTPEVKLTSNETGQSNAEWAYTSGKINVETGAVNNQADAAVITMHTQSITDATYTAIYDALVVPGSTFSADNATITRINADGNIYYVTAKEIRKAITTKYGSGNELEFKTQPGQNYIITVNVKKTKIDVTATIKDWDEVVSETVYPVINVDASYGVSGTALGKEAFSFYRSTAMNTGYSNGLAVGSYYPGEAVVKKPTAPATEWIFEDGSGNPKPLFWPDHSTHYQMRGVWPLTGTATGEVSYPRVETKTIDTQEYQVISVKNVAYEAETFPSDLAIARPNVATDATCSNSDHTSVNLYYGGICATEGTVNLEFEYMMSKVEVNLSTTTGSNAVVLANAKVEVTNIYTTGDVKLGDRKTVVSGSTSYYTLHTIPEAGNENKRLDAIVPQSLTYTTPGVTTNVRFKITIYKNGDPEQGIDDIYYADVNPILETGKDTKIAPNGKWENGMHYVYNLIISKTKIDVTATFKDWINVNADTDIWF